MEESKKRFGAKNWLVVILVGLAGQLAWCIENNQINLWVYSQTQNSNYITWMTTISAIAATVTTFFMGVLSDRLGKRKIFIAGGYLLWGISVGAFALASYSNMAFLFGAAGASLAVGLSMALLDTVMTFFGSTANDACFNAMVTDITVPENRGKVESVLSVLPLLANVVMLFAQMLFGANANVDLERPIAETAAESAAGWQYFFIAFGAVVIIVGIIAFFLIDDSHTVARKEGNYWANLVHGFRPSVMKRNGRLYLALLTFMAFNAAVDSFLPYYMVYFQNPAELGGLGYSDDRLYLFYVSFAIILVVSAAAAILMAGYLIGTACLGAIVRDLTPKGEAGLFQGVRMVFAVMIPMIVGSNVSQLFFNLTGETYVSTTTFEEVYAPTSIMFIVSLAFMALAIVPGTFFFLSERRARKKGTEEKADE